MKKLYEIGPDTAMWFEFRSALLAISSKSDQVLGGQAPNVPRIFSMISSGAFQFSHPDIPSLRNTILMHRLDLLPAHHIKQSTNPKDKVLALIGISEAQDDQDFPLDYSRSLQKIFTNVIKYLLICHVINPCTLRPLVR